MVMADNHTANEIDNLLHETRVFQPPSAGSMGFSKWHVDGMGAYKALHARSVADPEGFWGEEGAKLRWVKRR